MIRLSNTLAHLLVGLIRGYQYLLSPWLGPRCRYTPSCSEFAPIGGNNGVLNAPFESTWKCPITPGTASITG